MSEREFVDVEAYRHVSLHGPCFVCEIVARNPEYRHHIIYEDEAIIVFLAKYPILYGYTLVAPREHREAATGEFTIEEYLTMQRVIYRVAEALRLELSPERVYILCLGSQQGNSHVHWHVAPLPPGVPYEEQQFEALRLERGVLPVSDEEMAFLARRVRERMDELDEG